MVYSRNCDNLSQFAFPCVLPLRCGIPVDPQHPDPQTLIAGAHRQGHHPSVLAKPIPVFPGEFWTLLFAHLPAALILFNDTMHVVYANDRADQELGDGEKLHNRLNLDRNDPGQGNLLQALASLFTSATQVEYPQFTLPSKDGPPRQYHLVARRITAAGEPLGLLLLHEISEITTLEQRLAVSERMAAVGQLSAKVAHELNNPLDGIMRYIALALRKIRDKQYDDLERYLEDVKFGLNRMAEIVRELLEFGRHNSSVMQDSELNYVIEQAIRTMKPLADRQAIPIITDLSTQFSTRVSMNLYQVLCNLLKNAIDAMPHGGQLTLRTLKQDDTAVIEVGDAGRGIRPEDMPNIFEPFFSTKPAGQGTGLGLAVCKEIVEKMGGTIAARNLPGGGCEFSLRLPRIFVRAQETKASGTWSAYGSDYQI